MKSIHRSKFFWVVVVLVLALVVVRLMLPFWVRDYVNKRLAEMDDYRGHVESVHLALWRGAYQIRTVKIVKTSGDVPVPFFTAPWIDLSVQWLALFHGAFVGEVHFERPVVNFVNAPSKADSQSGLEEPWAQKLKQLFPLKINRFTANDGTVHYRDFHRSPKVDVVFDQVRVVAKNLTNSDKLAKTLHANIEMEARPLRAGDVRVKIDLDPYAAEADFQSRDRALGAALGEAKRFRQGLCRHHF